MSAMTQFHDVQAAIEAGDNSAQRIRFHDPAAAGAAHDYRARQPLHEGGAVRQMLVIVPGPGMSRREPLKNREIRR